LLDDLVQKSGEAPTEVYLRLARWYAEREQYGSAYTTLREVVTDQLVRLAEALGIDSVRDSEADDDIESTDTSTVSDSRPDSKKKGIPGSSAYRTAVDRAFIALVRDKGLGTAQDATLVTALRRVVENHPDIRDSGRVLQRMTDQRNKINHAFKGNSSGEKVTRDPETRRLTLHGQFFSDLENVRKSLAILERAIQSLQV
jgi:hypothetical protein